MLICSVLCYIFICKLDFCQNFAKLYCAALRNVCLSLKKSRNVRMYESDKLIHSFVKYLESNSYYEL